MSRFNKVRRLQGCSVLVPFEQSQRVSSPFCVNKSIEMKQKRLAVLKK
jgi:hypothetical protein